MCQRCGVVNVAGIEVRDDGHETLSLRGFGLLSRNQIGGTDGSLDAYRRNGERDGRNFIGLPFSNHEFFRCKWSKALGVDDNQVGTGRDVCKMELTLGLRHQSV